MTNNVNSGSYAQFEGFDSIAYNCISHLMEADETVWKLVYYNTPTAWKMPDLTKDQKISLIYNGSDNTADYRIFMDQGQPDVTTTEQCQIRISPHSIFPENRVIGTVSVIFEVYSHYKLNHLTNYKTRIDMITERFIRVFNGFELKGFIGKLYFDRLASESNRLEWGGQSPFKGRWIIMSAKSD